MCSCDYLFSFLAKGLNYTLRLPVPQKALQREKTSLGASKQHIFYIIEPSENP